MAGVPAGEGPALAGGPGAYPPWPAAPAFAGAEGRAAGGAPGDGGFFLVPGLAGVPAEGVPFLAGGPEEFPAWPAAPVFAGAAGRAAGGGAAGAPGTGSEFFSAPGLAGVPAGGGALLAGEPRGAPPWPAAPGFASLVKSAGLAP